MRLLVYNKQVGYRGRYLYNIARCLRQYFQTSLILTQNVDIARVAQHGLQLTKSFVSDATVLTDGYYNEMLIHRAAGPIWFFTADGRISDQDVAALPFVTKIITQDIDSAWRAASTANGLGYRLPVYCVPPWVDEAEFQYSTPRPLASGFVNCLWETANLPRTFSRKLLTPELIARSDGTIVNSCFMLQPALESMLVGRPVIVPTIREHLNEFQAIIGVEPARLPSSRVLIQRARDYAITLVRSIPKAFEAACQQSAAIFAIEVVTSNRWLVQSQTLDGGRIKAFPDRHDPKIRSIMLPNAMAAFRHFSSRPFEEVFVFQSDWDGLTPSDYNEFRSITDALGKRALRIHVCTDVSLGQAAGDLGKRLSVISVAEGLRQVGYDL